MLPIRPATLRSNSGEGQVGGASPSAKFLSLVPHPADKGRDDDGRCDAKGLRDLRHDVSGGPRTRLPGGASRESSPERIAKYDPTNTIAKIVRYTTTAIAPYSARMFFSVLRMAAKDSRSCSWGAYGQQIERIHCGRAIARAPVEMRARHSSSCTDQTDLLTSRNCVALATRTLLRWKYAVTTPPP